MTNRVKVCIACDTIEHRQIAACRAETRRTLATTSVSSSSKQDMHAVQPTHKITGSVTKMFGVHMQPKCGLAADLSGQSPMHYC